MKSFHVEFDVEQSKLSTIIDVISKEVSNLNVVSNDIHKIQTMKAPRTATATTSEMIAKTKDWIAGMQPGSPFSTDDVKAFLGRSGFKPANSGPIMSHLRSKIPPLFTDAGRGRYCRVGLKAPE